MMTDEIRRLERAIKDMQAAAKSGRFTGPELTDIVRAIVRLEVKRDELYALEDGAAA